MSMTTAIRIVQDNLSQNLQNASVLRSGTTVKGRVLAANGNGSYTVSLAGKMIEVKSEAKLTVGQVFQAKVKITGNQLALSLVQESKNTDKLVQKLTATNQNLSPEVQNLLSSLGFEPNAESFKILQFMQQIGIKIDAEAAKKALTQAKKDGFVNEEEAQVSFLLDEKGLPSDEEKVNAVLGRNQDNQGQEKRRKGGSGSAAAEREDFSVKGGAKASQADRVSKGLVKDYFDSVDFAAETHDSGILTAFNSILSGGKKSSPLRHWLFLPFEWDFKNYSGNIRFLFDSELKNLEKTIINLKNREKSNIFVLYYKNSEIEKVRFASDSPSFNGKHSVLTAMLSKNAGKIHVEQCDFNLLCGFCSDDESFACVRGSA
ncbi:hypothetical protein [uncultured Treponema sp.]|uniref:hypothetical protein n=1 Tax=uncultured Treponema sp. TaxID=162155 RepID=UPI0025DF3A0C|nr:hypothetical protein [uncultured Treponema sp.]